jgi:hypothetical protein
MLRITSSKLAALAAVGIVSLVGIGSINAASVTASITAANVYIESYYSSPNLDPSGSFSPGVGTYIRRMHRLTGGGNFTSTNPSVLTSSITFDYRPPSVPYVPSIPGISTFTTPGADFCWSKTIDRDPISTGSYYCFTVIRNNSTIAISATDSCAVPAPPSNN